MPTPARAWYHLTWGTHHSWLPGDRRGFRSHDHKLHSSGDHRHPPPPDEHAGLRDYWRQRAGQPVILPKELRPLIGQQVVRQIKMMGYRVLIVGVSGMHVHALAELPAQRRVIQQDVGRCKRAASFAVKDQLPGRIWARLAGIKPIKDGAHQANVFNYILTHEKEGGVGVDVSGRGQGGGRGWEAGG